jgi:hypothetical protein
VNLTRRAEQELARVLAELRSEGFTPVRDKGGKSGIPPAIFGFAPDAVVQRDDEIVIVAIRRGGETDDKRLRGLADEVSAHPEIRLDLILSGHSLADPSARDQVFAYVDQASQAMASHRAASFLLGWQAVEFALDQLLQKPPLPFGPEEYDFEDQGSIEELFMERRRFEPNFRQQRLRSSSDKVAEAESLGLISGRVYKRLSWGAEFRNNLVHRGYPGDEALDVHDIKEILDIASRLVAPGYASPDEMADWFYERLEAVDADAFERRKFNGHGFNSVKQTLMEEFPDVDPRDLEESVRMIEAESKLWAWKRTGRGDGYPTQPS